MGGKAVALSLSGITKTYDKVRALDGLNLDVPAGRFFVLFGPSAVGKTTTLRAVSGLVRPDSGSIRIGDRDVTDAPIKGRGVSMVFQSFALYPHLTVFKNLAYPLIEDGLPSSDVTRQVREMAHMLKLAHRPLYGVGCALVVFAGLANNLLPLCQPGVTYRSLFIAALIVALAFCVIMLISISAAHLYGAFFVNAIAPATGDPFYLQPFVWGVAAAAIALAVLLTALVRSQN